MSATRIFSRIFSHHDPDIITIQLLLPSPLLICVVYMSPSLIGDSSDVLLNYLHQVSSTNFPLFVLGDFNCPNADWNTLSGSDTFSNLLCDLIFDHQLRLSALTHLLTREATYWI